ncbi:hypothetical protein ACF0H5_006440 [Mactra antiquata]
MSTPINSLFNLRVTTRISTEKQDAEIDSLEFSTGLSELSDISCDSDFSIGELNSVAIVPSSEEGSMALNIQLKQFEGKPGEYGEDWLETYDHYCKAQKLDNGRKFSLFSFMLKGHASSWYKTLPADIKMIQTGYSHALRRDSMGLMDCRQTQLSTESSNTPVSQSVTISQN